MRPRYETEDVSLHNLPPPAPVQVITFTSSNPFVRLLASKRIFLLQGASLQTHRFASRSKVCKDLFNALSSIHVIFLFITSAKPSFQRCSPAYLPPSLLFAFGAFVFFAPQSVSPSSLGLLVCTSCRIMSSPRSSRTRRLLLFWFCTRNTGVFFSCAGSSETTTSEIACESPSAVTSYQGSDECQKCSRLINRNICCFFSFN